MNLYDNGNLIHGIDDDQIYLDVQDDKAVSVNNFLLEQHQIEALRFLFDQYKKKSPGAVVNFPSSCGKSAAVAVFLSAVSSTIRDPVLIICKDVSEIEYWQLILRKWSSYDEGEIAVESANPFTKEKKVFLQTPTHLQSHLRRQWSVVIIKHDSNMLKHPTLAHFKIFITSTDLKKDLSLLTSVNTWLYPKRKVNINDFVAKDQCPKERFKKSVQLDFLLEDFAIRRYINLVPFQTSKTADNITELQNTARAEHCRKRPIKDVTGTKIKRLRRVTDDVVVTTSKDQNIILKNNETGCNNQKTNLLNDLLANKISGDAGMVKNNQTVNIPSNRYTILMNEPNMLNGNLVLLNNDIINKPSNDNGILINDIDEILLNNNNRTTIISKDYDISNPCVSTMVSNNSNRNRKNVKNYILVKAVESKPNVNCNTINKKQEHRNSLRGSSNVTCDLERNVSAKQNRTRNEDKNKLNINYHKVYVKKGVSNGKSLDSPNINISKKGINTNESVICVNDIIEETDQNIILINDIDEENPGVNYHINNKEKESVCNKNIVVESPNVSNISHQDIILINDVKENKPTINTINVTKEHTSDNLSGSSVDTNSLNQNIILIDIEENKPNINTFKEKKERGSDNPLKIINSSNQNIILIDDIDESKPNINCNTINMEKEHTSDSPYDSRNDIITSNQNIILIDDGDENKHNINTSNVKKERTRDSPLNVTNSANQNIILIDDVDESKPNINCNSINMHKEYASDISNSRVSQNVTDNFNQNIIYINDDLFSYKPNVNSPPNITNNSNQNVILIDDVDAIKPNINVNTINIEKKHVSDMNYSSNVTNSSNENVILIDDVDASKPRKNNPRYSPIIINDDSDLESGDDFKIYRKKYSCDKINDHKSDIIGKNDSFHSENVPPKLDVESFIRNQKPITRCDVNFTEFLGIDKHSNQNLSEITLDSKEFLHGKLIEPLNFHNSKIALNVKEESTDSSGLENPANINLNEIKHLRKELIESLGFNSECLLDNDNSVVKPEKTINFDNNIMNEESTETLSLGSAGKIDITNALQNKNILEKNLLESLGFDHENEKVEIKKELTDDKSLIEEQLIESLRLVPDDVQAGIKKEVTDDHIKEVQSFGLDEDVPVEQSNDGEENNKILQKQLIESLGLSPDVKQAEINKELSVDQNRKMLQKQLIESLGLDQDDENVDVTKESSSNQNSDEQDSIKIKIEPDNDIKIEEHLNVVNAKKSDESDKDLDIKISLIEERALEKFKGSLLDSLF